ncbi:MAG: M24 family metallopeptidase [Candidatus Helarchaeota archaeon]
MKPIGFEKDRAIDILNKFDIDLIIASSPVNVFYLTGLPSLHVWKNPILYVLENQYPFYGLVKRDGSETLLSWAVFQSVDKFSWVKDIRGTISPKQSLITLVNVIKEFGLEKGKIGLERYMHRYQSEYLRAELPEVTFVDADDAILEMRLIKTDEEINRIKKSTEIAEKAIFKMVEETKEDITDNDLLQIAKKTIIEEGAEGWDHLTLGIGASDPEAPGIGTKMKVGDIARYDIGAVWGGYVSDVSRHVVLNEIPPDAKEKYDMMVQVQEFCEENIKPGVSTVQIKKDSKKFAKSLSRKGLGIITAHSIGLETEELHLFSPMGTAKMEFQENMVLDIEVWTEYKNAILIGIEDCYVIRKDGVERISKLDKGIFIK